MTRIVTLACFCCEHRNPAGAKFCNDCGTPLHLKPCKHCEAINVRAAAHCHRCGETFALEFPALDEAGPPPDALGAAAGSSPVGPTPGAAHSPPTRRNVIATRAVALLLGMSAIALLSAYYAYRHPGIGSNAAANGEGSQPADAAVATAARPEPTTAPMPPGTAPEPSSESPAVARAPPDGPGPHAVVGPAAATSSDESGARALPAPTPKAAAARAASSSAKRSVEARAAKAKAAGRRVARAKRIPQVAATQREKGRQVEERPPPVANAIAQQHADAVPPVRWLVADPGPAQRSKVSASRPTPASGGWEDGARRVAAP